MVDTEGGAWGGAARGLQAGLGIGGAMQDRAQRGLQLQQENQFRTQELGLQTRAADRADQEALMNMHRTALDVLSKQIDDAQKDAIGLASQYGVDSQQAQDAANRIQLMKQQGQYHYDKILAPEAYDGIRQAQTDAADLASNKVSVYDLPDDRFAHVIHLTGDAAINHVDGHDHDGSGDPNQRSPMGQRIDALHTAAAQGDWSTVHDHATALVSPHASPHAPDHDDHYPGIRAPYAGDPNDPHAHIAQTADIVGAKGTINAAINSDPTIQQKLKNADAQGATDQYNAIRMFAMRIGGLDKLPSFMLPDKEEKSYLAAKKAGYKDQDAWLMAYAPGVAAERERVRGEAGLRASEMAKNYADVDYLRRRGLTPMLGDDNHVYTQDPNNPSMFIDENGSPKPPDVKLNKPGVARPQPKPDVHFPTGLDPNNPLAATPILVNQDGTYTKLKEKAGGTPKPASGAGQAAAPAAGGGEAAAASAATDNPLINPATGKFWGQ